MAKSAGVIIARVVVVVLLLAAIGAIIYFLVIRNNDDRRGPTYEEMNRILNSENQATFEQNIGELETGNYFNYANGISNVDFKNVYLSYYMDKQILNTYKDLLLYVGNADARALQSISNNLAEYKSALVDVIHSQELFNITQSQGIGASEVATNFGYFVADFIELQQIFHVIVNDTFNYVTQHYYENINAFLSQKYAQTYILNIQSGLINSKLTAGERVNEALYQDSLAMVKFYTDCAENSFTEQADSASSIPDFIALVSNMSYDFSGFYNAESKLEFYDSADDSTKSQLQVLARGLGLTGRL